MSGMQVPPPEAPRPAVRISRPATTGDTVTIACKLPSGVILRIFTWQTFAEPQRDGNIRDVKRAIPIPEKQFVVRGPWVASAGQAYNNVSAVSELLPGGYALTDGCPREIWDTWLEQNKDSDLVKNHIIFGHSDRATVIEEVRKHSAILTGLEPLDRGNPAGRMGGIDRRLRMGILEQGEDTR